ncbi:hypothetical protein C7M84_011416 [Penaeus vannamei]|uniref:EGF-like domain-containing protein n=1 Tax=Penaeus vannamei TaxID=6689 RepID=A0A3R7M2V3_PENVA|nr:hypothetical protein C7M84_011416 [Penaeus vannamei]
MKLLLVQTLLVTLSAASQDFDLTLFCCPTNDRILTELQKVQVIDDKLATLTSTIRRLQEAMTKQHTAIIHQVEITRRQVEELTAKVDQMDTRREDSDQQMADFMAGTEDYLATVASRFQELLEILEKQYKASGRSRQELEKKVNILDIIQRQTAMDVYTLMTDVDECLLGNATCHPSANCNNIAGSFLCLCDGGHCAEGSNDCHGNATCTNLKGGYNCTCLPGYEGDGRTCVDVDECKNGTHSCHHHALCTNTGGGYFCTCYRGYTGDGFNCTDPLCEEAFYTTMGECFHFLDGYYSWDEARAACKKLGEESDLPVTFDLAQPRNLTTFRNFMEERGKAPFLFTLDEGKRKRVIRNDS